MAKKSSSPFDVRLSPEQREYLAHWIARELQNALDAKTAADSEVEYAWQLYEQARTRFSSPWPDAADLTSYLASEKVDAIAARGMRTIWADPIWTVEGWGDAADRAPFVEEFHQWKAEEERLQSVLDRLWIMALVEPRGLLEVYEGVEYRVQRNQMNVAVQTDPITGGTVHDESGDPVLQTGNDGKYIEAQQGQDFHAVTVVDQPKPVRSGPCYRILPYRDSAILPGHARDQQDIWGYAKRFWKRLSELQRAALGGTYDVKEVEKLSNQGDKEPDPALQRSGQTIAPQVGPTAEKELWECTLLLDLDAIFAESGSVGKAKPELRGSRWYVVTLALDYQMLLRIQHDDCECQRYLPVILFPRPDRVTEGYSLIGHKMITIIEEHTAWRNMQADRGKLLLQLPIKRQQGALWDQDEQPFGPNAVIDVRDMREIEPFVIPEVGMQEGFTHIAMCERNAEKVAGVNDIAAGQVSEQSRTLGEVQMATEQAFVRMDAIIRRFNEFMEPLAEARHVIWKRCLAEQEGGIDAPQSLLAGMEGRGVSIDQYLPDKKITAQLLDGAFRFKPKGSVETADKGRLRNDFTNAMKMLPQMLQMCQALPPAAGRALLREFLTLWNIPTQGFLGSPEQDLLGQQQANLMPSPLFQPPPMMGMAPPGMPMNGPPQGGGQSGPPGMPPGMPPGAPGGPQPGANPLTALAAQLAQKFGHPPPGLAPGPQGPQ